MSRVLRNPLDGGVLFGDDAAFFELLTVIALDVANLLDHTRAKCLSFCDKRDPDAIAFFVRPTPSHAPLGFKTGPADRNAYEHRLAFMERDARAATQATGRHVAQALVLGLPVIGGAKLHRELGGMSHVDAHGSLFNSLQGRLWEAQPAIGMEKSSSRVQSGHDRNA